MTKSLKENKGKFSDPNVMPKLNYQSHQPHSAMIGSTGLVKIYPEETQKEKAITALPTNKAEETPDNCILYAKTAIIHLPETSYNLPSHNIKEIGSMDYNGDDF